MTKDNILVIGANGQIGSVLTGALRENYGERHVIATDIKESEKRQGIFEFLNVLEQDRLAELVDKYKVNQIYHLAAILSAKGEANPRGTWDINMNSLMNVFEVAREKGIKKVFFPSSIAVFGKDIQRINTPQDVKLEPSTVYGISKVAGELWSQYYYRRFGIDIRSLRYPGVVGYQSEPGGGTTDYAVDIYHYAVQDKHYQCFLEAGTRLPMIFMDDAIRATLELMEAPSDSISIRTSYNLSGMSFSPAEIATSIQDVKPGFTISYEPDHRQQIAASWPDSIDDSQARKDWNWKPAYNLPAMTEEMIRQLERKYMVNC